MKKVLSLFVVALLAGCDVGALQNSTHTAPPVAASYFSKNSVYLPDGVGIQFNGKLRNYALIESEKGGYDRYVFEFSEDIMAVEGAVFATLAKSGYQRKVRREDAESFVVDYNKKGFETVMMVYERVSANKDAKPFTQLKVVWKNT